MFGKRTGVQSAHEKYANQQANHLLQRLEAYNGLAILAAERRAHLDEAFLRRFRTIIHFPALRAEERLAIWQQALPRQLSLVPGLNWPELATRYALTGADIQRVAQCCTAALAAAGSAQVLTQQQLEHCIRQVTGKAG